MKYLILLFSIQVFAQVEYSERAKDFEQVTGIKLGRYKLTSGDENACRPGTLHVIDLENRFTLMLGQMGLVFSLGIGEVAFEEDGCKTVDHSSYSKGEVKQHRETTCEGQAPKILDTLLQKTKKGFKYVRTVTQDKQVLAEDNCELQLR